MVENVIWFNELKKEWSLNKFYFTPLRAVWGWRYLNLNIYKMYLQRRGG